MLSMPLSFLANTSKKKLLKFMFNRSRIQVGLLVVLVLGSYYPVLFAGETLIDDRKMLQLLDDVNSIDIKGIFGVSGGLYYRPLTILTFVCDKIWWDLAPSFMHLENVLIHLLNTLLVYLGGRFAARHYQWEGGLFPFFAAALFALHPVNVEAVAWISGRTDLLATLFVLSAMILALFAAWRSSPLIAFAAMMILVLGGTAKETALFSAPVLLLVLLFFANDRKSAIHLMSAAIFPCIIAAVAYLAIRSGSFSALDQGFQLLARGGEHYPWYDTPRVVFKIIGFYFKKLFVPHPLNFAIVSVSNWYVLVGVIAMAIAGFFAWRQSHVALIFCFSLILLVPAIIVAFIGIAWTPLAERYLYQPTIFWSLAVALAMSKFLNKIHRQTWLPSASMLIILPMMLATADRAALWGDPAAFYADTLKKSPQFNSLRNELGLALAEQGEDALAAEQFTVAINNDPVADNVLYYVNHALLLSRQGRDEEARRFIRDTLARKPVNDNAELYKVLIRIDSKLLHENRYSEASLVSEVKRELLQSWKQLYLLERDPFTLYRGGQVAMQLNDEHEAAELFLAACRETSDGAYFKEPACKLAERFRQKAK